MPLSEQLEQINRQLAGHLEGIVDELRRTYLERLRTAYETALSGLDEIRPQLPASLVAPETLSALAAALAPPPPAPPAPRPAFVELLQVLRRIDGARTQSELLEGLLEGARSFCGRSALFVTSEEGTRGWAASGFGPGLLAIDDLASGSEPGSPLARLFAGQGAVELAAGECAALVGELSPDPIADGALVPIVLRDRLAAALYVDRVVDAPKIDLAAVQSLGYAAAQTLELLGLRERPATPTLFLAGEGPALEPLPLWTEALAAEVAADEPAVVEPEIDAVARWEDAPAVETIPEPEPDLAEAFAVASPATETPDESTWKPGSAIDSPAEQFLFSAAPPELSAAGELAAGVATAAEPFAFEPTVGPAFDLQPETEPAANWDSTADDTAAASVPIAEAGETWSEPVFELAPEDEQVFELAPEEPASASFVPADETPAREDAAASEPAPISGPTASSATGFERPVEAITASVPAQSFPWNSPAATQRIPVAPAPPSRADLSEDETVMIPRSGLPNASEVASPFATGPTPAPTPSSLAGGWPASDRAAGSRGSEVVPPPDLQGPGWAFSSSRSPVASGDETLHEEARRLARLLVSEIKLYNEEQVEDGRRHKDIYPRLKDDIDRSRQLYEERVHERVRATTDYFQQELVRNLAGGDPSALGR